MEINIRPATLQDHEVIAAIGRKAVELAHRDSCSVEDMQHYLATHYRHDAIINELVEPKNCYSLIFSGTQAAGFSKIVPNMEHPNISLTNVTKLDRIYLLDEFYDQKLGYQLLQYNIGLSKKYNQSGMWLFTWTGNERAVRFYKRVGFTVIGSHNFKVSETHYNPNHQMFLSY